MLDDLNSELSGYFDNWQKLQSSRKDTAFFSGLKPIAVGWKVAHASEYQKLYQELRSSCDKIVETWMNGRWIAKAHLRESELHGGIQIVKIMQRRSGSMDKVGLDHVDFYNEQVNDAEVILRGEPDLKWTLESNDAVKDYTWISVWFDGTEAKLRASTVLDTIIQELETVNRQLKAQ